MSKSIWSGNIMGIRAVEDAIRATTQYTEELGSMRKHHPIQGEDFASRVFTKRYNIYPGFTIDWNAPAQTAISWFFSDTPSLDVSFYYDYRRNLAIVTVHGGPEDVKELAKSIPGFSDSLARTIAGVPGEKKQDEKPAMGSADRVGNGIVPDTQPVANPTGNRP